MSRENRHRIVCRNRARERDHRPGPRSARLRCVPPAMGESVMVGTSGIHAVRSGVGCLLMANLGRAAWRPGMPDVTRISEVAHPRSLTCAPALTLCRTPKRNRILPD